MTRETMEHYATMLTLIENRRNESGCQNMFNGILERILTENEADIRDATAAVEFAEACDQHCVRRLGE